MPDGRAWRLMAGTPAFIDGINEPAKDPDDRPQSSTTTKSQAKQDEGTSAPLFSDEYLALRFADQHGHELRYVAVTWVSWLIWMSTHWWPDDTLTAFSLSR